MSDIVEVMARALMLADPESTSDWQDYSYDALEALGALHSAGYAIVPREPTEVMVNAFIDQKHLQGEVVWQAEPEDVWAAMIAAAEGSQTCRNGRNDG